MFGFLCLLLMFGLMLIRGNPEDGMLVMGFGIVGGDLNNYTREFRLGKSIRDFLSELTSVTARLIKSRGMTMSGPMGNDIGFVQDLDEGSGGHYSGYDEARQIQAEDASRGYRAEWSFAWADAAMAGTTLKRNAGITTEQLINGAGHIADMPEGQQIQIDSQVGKALKGACQNIANRYQTDVWDIKWPDDTGRSKQKPALTRIMDPTASWLGVPPDGFDEWSQTSVWRHAPVSTLTEAQGRYFRNVPQIFGASSNRNLEVALLDDVSAAMSERINGIWACPLNRFFWGKLINDVRKNGDGLQYFMKFGEGDYALRTRCVKINRFYFYLDSRAPADKIYCAHIGGEGLMDDDEHAHVGFGCVFWMPDEISEVFAECQEMMYEPENINGTMIADLMGVDRTIPLEPRSWQFAQNNVDAVFMRLLTQWAWVGQRYKNAVVQALNTS